MNISDLLGAMMQSGMTPSSDQRLKNALGGGGGNLLESLGNLLGGQQAGLPSIAYHGPGTRSS